MQSAAKRLEALEALAAAKAAGVAIVSQDKNGWIAEKNGSTKRYKTITEATKSLEKQAKTIIIIDL